MHDASHGYHELVGGLIQIRGRPVDAVLAFFASVPLLGNGLSIPWLPGVIVLRRAVFHGHFNLAFVPVCVGAVITLIGPERARLKPEAASRSLGVAGETRLEHGRNVIAEIRFVPLLDMTQILPGYGYGGGAFLHQRHICVNFFCLGADALFNRCLGLLVIFLLHSRHIEQQQSISTKRYQHHCAN